MNKRNFFKGLMALLAMPSNIYAKVFGGKDKTDVRLCRYQFTEEDGIVVRVDVQRPSDIQVGMLIEGGSQIFRVVEKPTGSFLHNGEVIENFMQNKFFVKNVDTEVVALFCFDCLIDPKREGLKFYVKFYARA